MSRLSVGLFSLITVFAGIAHGAGEQPEVKFLWAGVAPGSEGQTGEEKVRIAETGDHVVTNVHRPSLTVYPAEGVTGPALTVLIIPGGAHREIWTDHEGHNVARWLSAHGISAAILKYRLAHQEASPYTIETEVADGKRAIRVLRENAARWGVDPTRIGVIGFSAGGELAARVALAPDDGDPAATDGVERQSTHLGFQAIIYPSHPEIIQPTKDSPTAFLCWGFQDFPMIADGMGGVYSRFRAVGVPVEMHVYSDAHHGFGIRPNDTSPAGKWIDRFYEWLDSRGLMKPATSR